MMTRRSLAIFVGFAAVLGCDSPPLAKVGETFLVQAADTRELPANSTAETIELAKLDVTAPPSAAEIRLVAGQRQQWREVRKAVAALEGAGKTVRLLSAQRRRIGEFVLYDELGDRPIEVVTRTNGQACVRLPGVKEAKCVQRADAKHIDRAHLRQLVREAIKVSKLREVAVYVPGDMEWADVVRAVDAARTCCKETQRPKVKLVDLETREAPSAPAATDEAPSTGEGAPLPEPTEVQAPDQSVPMGDGAAGSEGLAPRRSSGARMPPSPKKRRDDGAGIAPADGENEAPPEEDSDESND